MSTKSTQSPTGWFWRLLTLAVIVHLAIGLLIVFGFKWMDGRDPRVLGTGDYARLGALQWSAVTAFEYSGWIHWGLLSLDVLALWVLYRAAKHAIALPIAIIHAGVALGLVSIHLGLVAVMCATGTFSLTRSMYFVDWSAWRMVATGDTLFSLPATGMLVGVVLPSLRRHLLGAVG